MRGLTPPAAAAWTARNDWFWKAHDVNAGPQPLDLEPREAALLAELELLFCVGAWASVVIVGWTLVEAVERRTARGDAAPASDVDWLRERRNALVHLSRDGAEMPDDAALEEMARGAVRVVFKSLFAEAWAGSRP
jgi:hypothetical protein